MNELAPYLEHTLLQPNATGTDIRNLCGEALQYGFRSVCVNPRWVSLAAELVKGTPVKVVTVVGFPLGANRTEIKRAEGVLAVASGASEIDMVADIGSLGEGRYEQAGDEIAAIAQALPEGASLKVIIECNLLSPDQQAVAARTAAEAGAQFVKTGTGFFGSVTIEQVVRLRQAIGESVQIKAAGGVRSAAFCHELIEAGAAVVGSSSCVQIVTEAAAWQDPHA